MERKEIMNRLEDADFSNVQANELANMMGAQKEAASSKKRTLDRLLIKHRHER
ncbi:MAG: hypothetical protein WD431_20550 [Cyclobacteriaceae bacterium]